MLRNYSRGWSGCSIWWRDICNLYWGDNGNGMRKDFFRKLGSGNDTSFWHDIWACEESFKSKFPRLFRLSSQKNCKVSDMGSWGSLGWVWNLQWVREVSSRNRDLLDLLLAIIGNCKPSCAGTDSWHWRFATNGIYNTSISYNNFWKGNQAAGPTPSQVQPTFKRLWTSWSPRKTIPCAWRLLKNRLPTMDNLARRGVVMTSTSCPLCMEYDECPEHLFFKCKISSSIWDAVKSWLSINMVMHINPSIHFLQFSEALGRKKLRKVAFFIWVGSVWSLWNLRNDVLFNNGSVAIDKVISILKIRLWHWICCREISMNSLNISSWLGDPWRCLEIIA